MKALEFIVSTVFLVYRIIEKMRLQLIFKSRCSYWKNRLKCLGKRSKFYSGVKIYNPSNVSIGKCSTIGDYVVIWGGGSVTIGDDVLIATHSVIASDAHDPNANIFRETKQSKPIVIEDNVWLGAGVLVMPGVVIGKNSVIGAGSVVTKDVPANSIAHGVPARVVKQRELSRMDYGSVIKQSC